MYCTVAEEERTANAVSTKHRDATRLKATRYGRRRRPNMGKASDSHAYANCAPTTRTAGSADHEGVTYQHNAVRQSSMYLEHPGDEDCGIV